MTIRSFFFKHYKPKRLLGKSHNTTRLYEVGFRKLSRFLGRPAVLSDLNDDTVSEYLAEQSELISMHTVKKEAGQLLAIWRFAARRKFIENYPELIKPDGAAPIPDAWTRDELTKLFTAISGLKKQYGPVPSSVWWEANVRTILDTGERCGALLQVRREHLSDGWLSVPASSRKGKQAGKLFKLSPKTIAAIELLMTCHSEEVVFYFPLHISLMWKYFGEILDSAGLPNNRRTKLHKLRRTVATYYEERGGNATVLLGHSSRKITQAYIDQRFIKTPQPCDLIEEI